MYANKRKVWRGVLRRLMPLVRCVDCSAESNAGDLLALLFSVVIICALAFAVFLSSVGENFTCGFFSSTIIWNWKRWFWSPMDKILKRVYSANSSISGKLST